MQQHLSEREQAAIEQALTALCPEWDLQQLQIDEFLTGGYSNKNYRLSYGADTLVLRLPGGSTGRDFPAEMTMLGILERAFSQPPELQLPVHSELAEIVAVNPTQGWLLSRWVDAPVLATVPEISGAQLGQYLATLHIQLQQTARFVDDDLGTTSNLIPSILQNLALVFPQPELQQKLQHHLAELTARTVLNATAQLSHIDLNPWNVLFDPNVAPARWVTLDWETLGFAPSLFDLVVLSDGYAYNHEYSPERTQTLLEQVLATYNRTLGIRTGLSELEPTRELFRWREFAWAAARLNQGELSDSVFVEVQKQRHDYAALLAPQARALKVSLNL